VPTQLAVVAVGVHTWAMPADVAAGLLAGAVVLAIGAPSLRR
jgi:hypothetical protein